MSASDSDGWDAATVAQFAAPRVGVLYVAFCWLVCGLFLLGVMDHEPFLAPFWPTIFAAAGVGTLAVYLYPESRRIHLTTAAVGLFALILRPASLAARWMSGEALDPHEALFRAALYALFAFLWFRFCESSLLAWRIREVLHRSHLRRK